MFDFTLENNELEALDTLVRACIEKEASLLPTWTYMGQDIWTMEFDEVVPDVASTWTIETADVA